MSSSYTKLSRLKIIQACEAAIADILAGRARIRENTIQNIMNRKRWFGLISPYTREQAEKIYKDSSFDYEFNVYLEWLSANYSWEEQEFKCKNLINLCKASNEELINISADDFYYIDRFYV